jgi:glycerol-3-phosphate acyltransferase PlsY
MLNLILLFLGAYFCGSIPFGKLIAHRRGVDIQKRGSGNIGFANVRRVLGWRDGILTLIGDITKGALPTAIALYYFDTVTAFIAGVIAILGHIFCVWLRFHGGKGVATGLGVVAILSPLAAVVGATIYVIFCYLQAKSSNASIIGALTTAIVAVALEPHSWWQYGIFLAIIAWTLRRNLWGTIPNYDA